MAQSLFDKFFPTSSARLNLTDISSIIRAYSTVSKDITEVARCLNQTVDVLYSYGHTGGFLRDADDETRFTLAVDPSEAGAKSVFTIGIEGRSIFTYTSDGTTGPVYTTLPTIYWTSNELGETRPLTIYETFEALRAYVDSAIVAGGGGGGGSVEGVSAHTVITLGVGQASEAHWWRNDGVGNVRTPIETFSTWSTAGGAIDSPEWTMGETVEYGTTPKLYAPIGYPVLRPDLVNEFDYNLGSVVQWSYTPNALGYSSYGTGPACVAEPSGNTSSPYNTFPSLDTDRVTPEVGSPVQCDNSLTYFPSQWDPRCPFQVSLVYEYTAPTDDPLIFDNSDIANGYLEANFWASGHNGNVPPQASNWWGRILFHNINPTSGAFQTLKTHYTVNELCESLAFYRGTHKAIIMTAPNGLEDFTFNANGNLTEPNSSLAQKDSIYDGHHIAYSNFTWYFNHGPDWAGYSDDYSLTILGMEIEFFARPET